MISDLGLGLTSFPVLWRQSTPLNIFGSSLLEWVKGTTLSGVEGSAISQWDDLSGKNNHLTQAVAGNRPTLRAAALNGRNTVRFTEANSQFFNLTNQIQTDSFTCISVKRRAGPGGNNSVILFGSDTGATCFWNSLGNIYIYGNEEAYFSDPQLTADYAVVTVAKAAGVGLCRVNGTDQSLSLLPIPGLGNTYSSFGYGGLTYCNGEVAEVMLIEGIASIGQVLAAEAYLKAEWGIL